MTTKAKGGIVHTVPCPCIVVRMIVIRMLWSLAAARLVHTRRRLVAQGVILLVRAVVSRIADVRMYMSFVRTSIAVAVGVPFVCVGVPIAVTAGLVRTSITIALVAVSVGVVVVVVVMVVMVVVAIAVMAIVLLDARTVTVTLVALAVIAVMVPTFWFVGERYRHRRSNDESTCGKESGVRRKEGGGRRKIPRAWEKTYFQKLKRHSVPACQVEPALPPTHFLNQRQVPRSTTRRIRRHRPPGCVGAQCTFDARR